MTYYFTLEEFKEFWELEPVVVFDTSAILHLYKMSSRTTEDILKNFELISVDQFWLPAQVLIEYNKNKEASRKRGFKKYTGVLKDIKEIIDKSEASFRKRFNRYNNLDFPKIKELNEKIFKHLNEIKESAQKYSQSIKDEIDLNKKLLDKDKVDEFVTKLINSNCIGSKYTVSQLLELYREGEERYKYKIPPGYKDIEKDKDDPTKTQKFGDLIIWKQSIDKAAVDEHPIIFIINDDKEDWWVLENAGERKVPVCPRDELYDEFEMMTSQKIEIMTLNNFYTVFAQHYNVLNNRTAIEMNAEEVCQDILENFDWSTIIDKDGDLTASLIHDGVLQGYLDNILSDVDIYDHGTPSIEAADITIDEEDNVHIEAIFTNTLSATISEAFSSEYSEDENYDIKINGVILFEFKINDEDNTLIKADSEVISIKEFSITDVEQDIHSCCSICNMKKPDYYTNDGDGICERCSSEFDPCPSCGFYFEKGALNGGYCNECEKNS
ncbi:PIN-like domain-containing protein [Bacillus haynesii]|uniref:PIN-like domain-containing protein n=1 Tax=Bacillus haynesii TaxID=1925021 RepID=UPI0022811014|nr:PIN-like domain-containing protein [Bacillus haynesii]MCY9156241.1 PIN-like domain-containing protein [Bacillus haynesii]MCY9452944.1 PIN-like domain-containing protein [Bacillus haynesii]